MISKHPDSNLLTEYASGGLDLAQTIAITTHLQFCTECRSAVESLNTLGGEMLNQTLGECVRCPVGYFSDSMSMDCEQCPPKMVTLDTGMTSAEDCNVTVFLTSECALQSEYSSSRGNQYQPITQYSVNA